jgi:hypothetical protein
MSGLRFLWRGGSEMAGAVKCQKRSSRCDGNGGGRVMTRRTGDAVGTSLSNVRVTCVLTISLWLTSKWDSSWDARENSCSQSERKPGLKTQTHDQFGVRHT